jgi:ribonuclease HI
MNSYALFSDVSLNPQRQLGVGAYLLVPTTFLDREPKQITRSEVAARLQYRRFTETSSTKLEVQTILWALEEYREANTGTNSGPLRVYTDSQCVVGLLGRRSKLETTAYIARRSGQLLRNATLYSALYAAYDALGFTLIKVAGHPCTSAHDAVQRIFAHVDQEVRRALSVWLAESAKSETPDTTIMDRTRNVMEEPKHA